jgi:hypothetical protein
MKSKLDTVSNIQLSIYAHHEIDRARHVHMGGSKQQAAFCILPGNDVVGF